MSTTPDDRSWRRALRIQAQEARHVPGQPPYISLPSVEVLSLLDSLDATEADRDRLQAENDLLKTRLSKGIEALQGYGYDPEDVLAILWPLEDEDA